MTKHDPTTYVELAEKGLNNTEIADALGDVSEAAVRRGLKKVGYVRTQSTADVSVLPAQDGSRPVVLQYLPKDAGRLSALVHDGPPGTNLLGDHPATFLKQLKQTMLTRIRCEANLLRQAYVSEMTDAMNEQINEAQGFGYYSDEVDIPSAAEYLQGMRPRPNVWREWYYGPEGPAGGREHIPILPLEMVTSSWMPGTPRDRDDWRSITAHEIEVRLHLLPADAPGSRLRSDI